MSKKKSQPQKSTQPEVQIDLNLIMEVKKLAPKIKELTDKLGSMTKLHELVELLLP